MSIHDAINALEAAGELLRLQSAFLGAETPRAVYVSKEVAELVCYSADDTREGRMAARARALLDDFVEGGYVTIAENPFDKDSKCILARVAPVEREIWDFRCLDPKPGVRILGAFSETDVFIALTWDYRENFDDHWPERVAECDEAWKTLFGPIPPHEGERLNEYVSSNFRAV